MILSLRRWIAVLGCASIALICSCEKHHVGELPEHGGQDRVDAQNSTTAAGGTTVTPTPAEFFNHK